MLAILSLLPSPDPCSMGPMISSLLSTSVSQKADIYGLYHSVPLPDGFLVDLTKEEGGWGTVGD